MRGISRLIAAVAALGVSLPVAAAEGAKRKVREGKDTGHADAAGNSGSGLLPDWSVAGFDWNIAPVAAFRYQSVSADNQNKRQVTTFEGGLAAGLQGIPVVPGNPGLTLAPDAGMAYGYNFGVETDGDGRRAKFSSHYRRQWVGLGTTAYWRFLRYRLDLRSARLTVTETDDVTKTLQVGNDFGVLIYSWLSQHYTLTYLRAYTRSYGDKFLEDYDHWLHTRMFFDFMAFVVDVGPGFTQTAEFDPETGTRFAKGRTDYLLLKSGLNPVWKLVADGQAKYVYNATEDDLGNYASTRLPEDDLNEPETQAMPEDSFLGSLFVGVKDIAYGIGAGWRTNVQVLNVNRKDGAPKQTKKTQGLGLYAEVRF